MVNNKEDDLSIALGRQLTIEYYKCSAKVLLDKDKVEKALLKAAQDSGAHIINSLFHKFDSFGVSGVVVIAESHFAIHSWPEYNYAAVDIFTCSNSMDLKLAIDSIGQSFKSDNIIISSDQNRGILYEQLREGNTDNIIPDKRILPSFRKGFDSFHKKNDEIKGDAWGVLTSVDIYGADLELMQNNRAIENFVYELCNLIDIGPFKECRFVRSENDGETGELSMTHMAEASLISGCFVPSLRRIYMDVFSHKFYEPRRIAEFAMSFFRGDNYKIHIVVRQ